MPTPQPIQRPASSAPTNPNNGFTTSGDVGDWYVHVQTVDIMYVRKNQYNSDTSSAITGPGVTSNFLEMQVTAQTQDEIYYDVNFSSADSSAGNLFQAHILQLQSNNALSGGFGDSGTISTSAMGIIRRLANKDAAGNIVDPTGVVTTNTNVIVDQMPGAYDPTLDTSATANATLATVMGTLAFTNPRFLATLVDL